MQHSTHTPTMHSNVLISTAFSHRACLLLRFSCHCMPCCRAAHRSRRCPSHPQAGAVAGLRRIKQAALTARLVLEHTRHTLLAGDLATQFAVEMGLRKCNLSTPHSLAAWRHW